MKKKNLFWGLGAAVVLTVASSVAAVSCSSPDHSKYQNSTSNQTPINNTLSTPNNQLLHSFIQTNLKTLKTIHESVDKLVPEQITHVDSGFTVKYNSVTQQIDISGVTDKSNVQITQLDIGQGDCQLIQISQDGNFKQSGNQFDILVDTGIADTQQVKNEEEAFNNKDPFFINNQGQIDPNYAIEHVTNWLKYHFGITHLNMVIVSHFHHDHIGGIPLLVKDKFINKNTYIVWNGAEKNFELSNNNSITKNEKELFSDVKTLGCKVLSSVGYANDTSNHNLIEFYNSQNQLLPNDYLSILGGVNIDSSSLINEWALHYDRDVNFNKWQEWLLKGDWGTANNKNPWSVVNKLVWDNHSILDTGDLSGGGWLENNTTYHGHKSRERYHNDYHHSYDNSWNNYLTMYQNSSNNSGYKMENEGNNSVISPDIPISNYDLLKANILKAPHHGSHTDGSNNDVLLDKIQPQQIWISSGYNNSYPLPNAAVLQNFYNLVNNNIFDTEAMGGIGNKYTKINTWLEKHPLVNRRIS